MHSLRLYTGPDEQFMGCVPISIKHMIVFGVAAVLLFQSRNEKMRPCFSQGRIRRLAANALSAWIVWLGGAGNGWWLFQPEFEIVGLQRLDHRLFDRAGQGGADRLDCGGRGRAVDAIR